jgi:hypothetical protein
LANQKFRDEKQEQGEHKPRANPLFNAANQLNIYSISNKQTLQTSIAERAYKPKSLLSLDHSKTHFNT